jgi:hypothetical protein
MGGSFQDGVHDPADQVGEAREVSSGYLDQIGRDLERLAIGVTAVTKVLDGETLFVLPSHPW